MSESERLKLLTANPPWIQYKGNDKDYYVGAFDKKSRWLKIPPGGYVHKHADKAGWRRFHVLQTNPDSLFYVEGDEYHLEQGCIYEFDGRLEHWSVNNGNEDRIHWIDLKPEMAKS